MWENNTMSAVNQNGQEGLVWFARLRDGHQLANWLEQLYQDLPHPGMKGEIPNEENLAPPCHCTH